MFGAGASLSACGGTTVGTIGIGDGESGGAAPLGAGGVRSTAGAGGTQGSGGGFFAAASGGAIDAGPGPGASASAQWNCAGMPAGCDFAASRFELDGPCPVDPTLPRIAADCARGQWLECDAAEYQGKSLAVDCRCTDAPEGGTACDACGAVVLEPQRVLSCSGSVRLCGCAVTLIH